MILFVTDDFIAQMRLLSKGEACRLDWICAFKILTNVCAFQNGAFKTNNSKSWVWLGLILWVKFSAGVYRRSIFNIRPNILIGLQKLQLRPKDRSRSRLFIIFAVSRTGTVGSTEHWVTVPKCLHKTPKSIKNSAKVHQNPVKTDENFM